MAGTGQNMSCDGESWMWWWVKIYCTVFVYVCSLLISHYLFSSYLIFDFTFILKYCI